ncbi:MAG: hypothetical protein ACXADO_11445 [Candidatus Thorarchaeota archaeon]
MVIKRTRRFMTRRGRKDFRLDSAANDKRVAERNAKRLRDQGYNVRIKRHKQTTTGNIIHRVYKRKR